MKSIYSVEVLQRILDHWHVGTIEDVDYFTNPGSGIWRHHIETNQGVFELYSYPTQQREYAEEKISKFFEERLNLDPTLIDVTQIVHSFDKYHLLFQFSKKQQISFNQASTDLDMWIGAKIEKAFRVYGSIIQMHLKDSDVNVADVLVSYGIWNIHELEANRDKSIVDTRLHSRDELDKAVDEIEKNAPTILSYGFKDDRFELNLSNGQRLCFKCTSKFPALEVHVKYRKNNLLIFDENRIYYTRDLREQKKVP